jgi:hypothetical protein
LELMPVAIGISETLLLFRIGSSYFFFKIASCCGSPHLYPLLFIMIVPSCTVMMAVTTTLRRFPALRASFFGVFYGLHLAKTFDFSFMDLLSFRHLDRPFVLGT